MDIGNIIYAACSFSAWVSAVVIHLHFLSPSIYFKVNVFIHFLMVKLFFKHIVFHSLVPSFDSLGYFLSRSLALLVLLVRNKKENVTFSHGLLSIHPVIFNT